MTVIGWQNLVFTVFIMAENNSVYEIGGGSSSGNIPWWRRVNIDEITSTTITSQTFAGQRHYPSGEHSNLIQFWLLSHLQRDGVAE